MNGVKDLELCQFDFSLLKDWFGIKSWVITQTYGAQLLSEWIAELFDGSSGMLDIFIPLLPKLESSSSGSKRASTKGGGLDNPPKITLQRSLTDGIKSLFTFSRSREGLGSLLVHAQEESEVDLKNSIVSSLLLKRSTSSTSVHTGGLLSPIQPAIGSSSGNLNTSTSSSSSPTLATSSPFQPNHIHTSTSSSGLNHSAPTSMRPVLSTISSGHVLESSPSQEKRSSVESGSTASGEKPKLGVLDLYCALFPSRIHREHIIGLATLGIP